MKSILLFGKLASGGAERQMSVLACVLKKEKFDVAFLCVGDGTFFQRELEAAGIPIYRIHDNSLAQKLRLPTIRLLFLLYFHLLRRHYDTVISFLGPYNWGNNVTSWLPFTRHRAITGIRNNRKEVFEKTQERIFFKSCKNAYKIVSNSEAAQKSFSHYFPTLTEKLTTIYNIVNLPEIDSRYSPCKGSRVNIIVPASYRMVKNAIGMLEALKLMEKEDLDRIHIDWYGKISDGADYFEKVKCFVSANHLDKVVTLHDATREIANRINEADFVGLFSTSEGLPNSICEGMMMGKPIIMTRVSDYNALVGADNGFLCDAYSPLSICAALTLVANVSPQIIMNMGESSRKKAVGLFSEEMIKKKWLEIV